MSSLDNDNIAHLQKKIDEEIKSNGLDWTEMLMVSQQEANNFDNPEWLYENLIIAGHLSVFPAEPNGGKTTIFQHIAGVLAKSGLDVFYVNADVGQTDAKAMVENAHNKGFKLLLPDLKAGMSMQTIVDNFEEMNLRGGDFSNVVFILDTLKKMTDVINKKAAKELYKTLRGLSAKGMTVILLAHTNKYNDADGKPIFEGTGDLRSDVDELIYLIPKKNDDGSMTVSTEPDKVRGKFEPITFHISPERVVTQDNYVDVISIIQAQKQREEDAPIIELITESIKLEKFTTTKIMAHISDSGTGIGWRKAQRVLARYINKLWTCEESFQNNMKQYFLIGGDND